MKLIFRSIEQEQALAILNWCYPTPSDRYNFNADNIRLGNNLIAVASITNFHCCGNAVTMIISPSLGSEGDKSFR
jgi:hypothetical protein